MNAHVERDGGWRAFTYATNSSTHGTFDDVEFSSLNRADGEAEKGRSLFVILHFEGGEGS